MKCQVLFFFWKKKNIYIYIYFKVHVSSAVVVISALSVNKWINRSYGSVKYEMSAMASHFLQDCMWIQWRPRSAWASLQYDQSLQGTLWVARNQKHLQLDSKDSDQPVQMHIALLYVQSCRKCCALAHTPVTYIRILSAITLKGALTLCMLGKNFSRQHFDFFFYYYYSWNIGFDTSCK